MSYDGSYGRVGGATGGWQGYGQQDQSEYGGGGRGSDNYYNQQLSYNETSSGYQAGGSDYQSGSNYQQSGHDDYQGALSHAQQHSPHNGGNPEESNIFANALGFLAGNKHNFANENIDEHQAMNAHQAIYGESQHHQQQQQQHSSETLGAGAALQALKLFTGGGAGAAGHGSHGGGNSQNKLIGLAMAQASSLFDQQSKHGKVVSLPPFLYLTLPTVIS